MSKLKLHKVDMWKNNMCIKLECLIPSWKKAMSQKPTKFKLLNSILFSLCVEHCNCVYSQNDPFPSQTAQHINGNIYSIHSTSATRTCARDCMVTILSSYVLCKMSSVHAYLRVKFHGICMCGVKSRMNQRECGTIIVVA